MLIDIYMSDVQVYNNDFRHSSYYTNISENNYNRLLYIRTVKSSNTKIAVTS